MKKCLNIIEDGRVTAVEDSEEWIQRIYAYIRNQWFNTIIEDVIAWFAEWEKVITVVLSEEDVFTYASDETLILWDMVKFILDSNSTIH